MTIPKSIIILVVTVLSLLQSVEADAQVQLDDHWLGLWCDSKERIAVVNRGVDPDTILQEAREQIPSARQLIPADVRLVPPRHAGACVIPTVGPIRVTTVKPPWEDYNNMCSTFVHVAWVGPRRVLATESANVFGCMTYGLIVTPTMVFKCSVFRGTYPDRYVAPRCDVAAPPQLVGRLDSSMYPPDGAPRDRNGYILRYGEPGRCASFIDWPKGWMVWPAFTVERGRLIQKLLDSPWQLADSQLTKITWRKVLEQPVPRFWIGMESASFDFLGRGKSDAVFSFALDIYRPHAQFNGSFYIVIPERGGEIETITARLVRSYLHLAPQPDAWDLRQEIVDRLAPHFEAIVVDGTGIADHVEPSELRVVRDHGKTWLVMQRQDVVTRFKNALVLARVEKDGRQTPVCMYDRTRPPPFAQW